MEPRLLLVYTQLPPPVYVWRNDHRGHAPPEAREIERRIGRILAVGILAGGRCDVIEQAVVLVVDDRQHGFLPDIRVAGQSHIDIVNQRFSFAHVMVGMLVGRLMRAAGVVGVIASSSLKVSAMVKSW